MIFKLNFKINATYIIKKYYCGWSIKEYKNMMILSFKAIIVYIVTMEEIPFNKSLSDYKISTTISS